MSYKESLTDKIDRMIFSDCETCKRIRLGLVVFAIVVGLAMIIL